MGGWEDGTKGAIRGALYWLPMVAPPPPLLRQVLVDVNWRPVFWETDPAEARGVVMDYLSKVTAHL